MSGVWLDFWNDQEAFALCGFPQALVEADEVLSRGLPAHPIVKPEQASCSPEPQQAFQDLWDGWLVRSRRRRFCCFPAPMEYTPLKT